MVELPVLFDHIERTDPSPARHAEGSFDFLNRVATPYWAKIRRQLDAVFAVYARVATAEKAADLRARFRSPDPRQHDAAWWELYIFWLLCCLHPKKTIHVEPERPDETTRPDFAVAEGEAGPIDFWVEAVTTLSGIVNEGRHRRREAVVLDAINEIQSPDFRLAISMRSVGSDQPKKREIVGPLEDWLRTLSREEVISALQRGEARPQTRIAIRGWDIVLTALAKGQPGLSPNDRLIGMGPVSVGYVNDVLETRKTIGAKASRYGELEAPFVVAVMTSWPFNDRDALDVLYGSEAVQFDPPHPEGGHVIRLPDGVWAREPTRVSAVLFGAGVLPWTVARTWPRLWLNPAAAYPLDEQSLRVPLVYLGGSGELASSEPTDAPATLLGLDTSWPGPEDAWDAG